MNEIPVFQPTEELAVARAVAHPTCSHALVEMLVSDEDTAAHN